MHQRDAQFFGKNRTEAFSDGVFAIIITLLVLELRVPHLSDPTDVNELLAALWQLSPKLLSWAMSFAVSAIVWVNHHRLFEMLRHLDQRLFYANAFLLFWASFIPFPTALLGDYPHNPLAVSLYGVVMALLGVGFFVLRLYAQRHPHLLHDDVDLTLFRSRTRSVLLLGPTVYLSAALLAWVQPYVSFALYVLTAVYFYTARSTQRN